MLAVFLTYIFALYVLGPDLIFRWIVSLKAPSRTRTRNYGEQIAVACVFAALPTILAWEFTHHLFDVYALQHKIVLRRFLDGLFAQSNFDQHADAFYRALPYVWRLNLVCLLILYVQTSLLAFFTVYLIHHLGRLTRRYAAKPRLRAIVNWWVKPWTAEWHLRLSGMLLPTSGAYIQADILTKLDVLYNGKLVRHHLSADGSLVTVTLEGARKFKRQELIAARAEASQTNKPLPNPDDFWSAIPGTFFVIRADEVVSLNISYVEPVRPSELPNQGRQEVDDLLRQLMDARLREITASAVDKPSISG